MRNKWKFSFWTLLLLVTTSLLALFQIGVLKIEFTPKSLPTDDGNDNSRFLTRRSANTEANLPTNFGAVNDDHRFEQEYEFNSDTTENNSEDNASDDIDTVTVVDDSSSGESSADDNGNENDEDNADDGSGEKVSRKTETKDNSEKNSKSTKEKAKKKNKKNVLTESQLLNYHSKAVSKIWAPNIERNLV